TVLRMCSRKTKPSLSSRRDASNSLLVRGKWAMCIYRRKLKPILQKRTVRLYWSLPPRLYVCSTNHIQRKLGFFTLPVENNTRDVSCGSLADILRCKSHVRFTSENGHSRIASASLLKARSGHCS